MLCWNRALWLVKNSHWLAASNQSSLFQRCITMLHKNLFMTSASGDVVSMHVWRHLNTWLPVPCLYSFWRLRCKYLLRHNIFISADFGQLESQSHKFLKKRKYYTNEILVKKPTVTAWQGRNIKKPRNILFFRLLQWTVITCSRKMTGFEPIFSANCVSTVTLTTNWSFNR